MDILKTGLKEGLDKAQEEDKLKDQAEKINSKFVAAYNKLVKGSHIKSADAQDVINGFEAVRRLSHDIHKVTLLNTPFIYHEHQRKKENSSLVGKKPSEECRCFHYLHWLILCAG